MAIPEDKVFVEGYQPTNSQDFVFKEADGTLPLPQGHRVSVFAIAEYKERVFFGQASFDASIVQTENIPLKESTPSFIIKSIAHFPLKEVQEKAPVQKYYEDAKSVDKDINYLAGKLKNCTCVMDSIRVDTLKIDTVGFR